MIDVLVLLILITIGLIIWHSFLQSGRNIFEPVYFFLMGYFGVFVLQPFFGQEELLGSHTLEHMEYCLFIAWGALIVFYWGYRSRAAQNIFLKIPQPPETWPQGQLIPYALVVFVIGFVSYSIFIAQSGGVERFFSEARGLGAYQSSTAYLWSGRALLMPALAMLFIETKRPGASKLFRYFTYSAMALFFAFQFIKGQRAGVFLQGVSFLAWYYLADFKVQRLPLAKTILILAGIMLAVGFVATFRGEFYLGSKLTGVKEFAEKPLVDKLQTSFLGVLQGGTKKISGGEFDGFLQVMAVVPDRVGYDFGKYYLRYAYHWIPRLWWPDKPSIKDAMIDLEKAVPALYCGTITMLGMYYYHFGLIGIFLGSWLTGVLLGGIEYWRKLKDTSLGVLLIYMLFFSYGRGVLMVAGIFEGWDDLLPFTVMPVVGAFGYLKSKRNKSQVKIQSQPKTKILSEPVDLRQHLSTNQNNGGN